MIRKIALICVLFSLFTCNSKKKYEGKWADIYYSNPEKPEVVIIENDSIKFNYLYFDHWHKYPLTINDNQLAFDSFEVKAQFKKDTLVLNNKNFYIHEKDSLFDWVINKHLLSISLPELNNISFSTYEDYYYFQAFIGKRLDNETFSLQLNDKLTENFDDLIQFIAVERASIRFETEPFYTFRLFADKDTSLYFLEEVLYTLSKVNQLKIEFINSIDLKIDFDSGIYYCNSLIERKIPPINEFNKTYFENKYNYTLPPPPPIPSPNYSKNNVTTIVFLINNELYYNQEKISLKKLKSLVHETVRHDGVLISLYDFSSNYKSFLEFMAVIGNVYLERRNVFALSDFGKVYDSLEQEEKPLIKEKVPQKHIWSYSIPHYQSFVKEKKEFMGLKAKSIDSLLPKFYLDSASSAE